MNTVTIKINGMEYNLKGRENGQYLVQVAAYVDGKVKEIMGNNKKLSTTAVATLAALNIADELFKADKEIEELVNARSVLEERNLTLKTNIEEITKECESIFDMKENQILKLTNDVVSMEEKIVKSLELEKENNELKKKIDNQEKALKVEVVNRERLIKEIGELKKQISFKNHKIVEETTVCEEMKQKVSELRNELENVKRVNKENLNKLQRENSLLKSGNDDLRSAVEDSYIKISNLEQENKEASIRENDLVIKLKEVEQKVKEESENKLSKEFKEQIESLEKEITIIEDEYKKTKKHKEILKIRNKDIVFQLQNSKYKVLDLEKKLIDAQIELAKEKRNKNPLLK